MSDAFMSMCGSSSVVASAAPSCDAIAHYNGKNSNQTLPITVSRIVITNFYYAGGPYFSNAALAITPPSSIDTYQEFYICMFHPSGSSLNADTCHVYIALTSTVIKAYIDSGGYYVGFTIFCYK